MDKQFLPGQVYRGSTYTHLGKGVEHRTVVVKKEQVWVRAISLIPGKGIFQDWFGEDSPLSKTMELIRDVK